MYEQQTNMMDNIRNKVKMMSGSQRDSEEQDGVFMNTTNLFGSSNDSMQKKTDDMTKLIWG
jgi:hypothetical protein